MDRRLLFRVQGLHQVHFHLEGALAHGADVLVHVFPFGDEIACHFQAQHVHPQGFQLLLGRAADGDLLDAEDFEGTLGHGDS
ncbi:MAG: hypothetical protein QM756_23430 [Polyangiaceae bacterium]